MCIWEINWESKEELRYGKSPEQVQYLEEKLQNLKSQQHTVRQPVSLLRQKEKQKRRKKEKNVFILKPLRYNQKVFSASVKLYQNIFQRINLFTCPRGHLCPENQHKIILSKLPKLHSLNIN